MRLLSSIRSECAKLVAVVCVLLFYGGVQDEPKANEMTEFGKALWMVIQDKGPYSRSAFARLLGHTTGWEPSRQAVAQWLTGERNAPRELVPATVAALKLDAETARKLEHLYFYGQPGLPAKLRQADEDSDKTPSLPSDVPEEPGLTEENRTKLDAKRREWDERDREKRGEGQPNGAGSRDGM